MLGCHTHYPNYIVVMLTLRKFECESNLSRSEGEARRETYEFFSSDYSFPLYYIIRDNKIIFILVTKQDGSLFFSSLNNLNMK